MNTMRVKQQTSKCLFHFSTRNASAYPMVWWHNVAAICYNLDTRGVVTICALAYLGKKKMCLFNGFNSFHFEYYWLFYIVTASKFIVHRISFVLLFSFSKVFHLKSLNNFNIIQPLKWIFSSFIILPNFDINIFIWIENLISYRDFAVFPSNSKPNYIA